MPAYLVVAASSLCDCCSHGPQLEPLPHLHAAPVAGDDGGQRVAVLQGALVAVVAVVQSPHTDHVTPAVTGLTEVDSNLQEAPAGHSACCLASGHALHAASGCKKPTGVVLMP
mgnify:CR=1 FL=1